MLRFNQVSRLDRDGAGVDGERPLPPGPPGDDEAEGPTPGSWGWGLVVEGKTEVAAASYVVFVMTPPARDWVVRPV